MSSNDIIEMEQSGGALAAQPAQSLTPMAIIQQAVASGADVEKLGQLMALQERWEANEARKGFTVALAKFKEAKIVVNKNKTVAYLDVRYKHATLDKVCDTIGEELSKHDLSFRWKTESLDNGKIKVTCMLTHILGHSESSSMEASPDTSAKKNAIQGIGSAVTYLQRYTLLAVTGTATGEDDDARGVFDDTQLQGHLFALYETKTKGELVSVFMRAASDASGDKKAFKKLEAARDEQLAKIDAAKKP